MNESLCSRMPREFCLRHPEVRDVCDVGQMLFYNWRWVWYVTAAMFILNNTFIQVDNLCPAALYVLKVIGFACFDRG